MTLRQRLLLHLQLFSSFFRIGPATFGGGYAMIPLIEHETVNKRGWLNEHDVGNLLSIAGTAPGGVGVNAAAFIGYRVAGITGAITAIIGITLPTFIIVLGLSFLYLTLDGNPKVEAAMKGIKAAVIALILTAAYRMARNALFDISTIVITLSTLAVLLFTGVNPMYVILAGLFVGIGFVMLKKLFGMQIHTEKERPNKRDLADLEYYI